MIGSKFGKDSLIYRHFYEVVSVAVGISLFGYTMVLTEMLNGSSLNFLLAVALFVIWAFIFAIQFLANRRVLSTMVWLDDFIYLVCRSLILSVALYLFTLVMTLSLTLYGSFESNLEKQMLPLLMATCLLVVSLIGMKFTFRKPRLYSKSRFDHMLRAMK
ncbi:hypothetical protein CW749_21520 [Vibrio sp. vnigr-6D03]|uniref:hypothetical protein n=1 Tax=Vibrio sp. vnigr-6D03 TaxID=2058088 RepID=UPI000C33B56E|nr:hypothetical protein [Vibrio sp. vnigr-6D03]PKF77664.1 hypothetical protein CW749_21520 [Vibrio sp. vnigr-6D03]